MESDINDLIKKVDLEGIGKLLSQNPGLANKGIPYDQNNMTLAHPLHRICDSVFNRIISDEAAVKIAEIFLEYGANVDGFELKEKKDTPLVAAASLHADLVALLYINHGANIHHGGCSGGTALHWAAWCGRDIVVSRLLRENPEIKKLCIDYKATPLFWAIHGYKFGGGKNRHHQIACAKLLLGAGADKNIPNAEGTLMVDMLGEEDIELKALLA